MDASVADLPSGSRDSRAKRHSADHTHASSSSKGSVSPSPGAHRLSLVILPSQVRPFLDIADGATEESDQEAREASPRTPIDSSPDQTPRGSPQRSHHGTPQRTEKRRTRLDSCDDSLDESAGRDERTPAVIETMHPPVGFDIVPCKPLLLSTTVEMRKGKIVSLAFLPPESKYDSIYKKNKERDPWYEDLAKLFKESQVNDWRSLVLDRKIKPEEDQAKLRSRHRDQRESRSKPRQAGATPDLHAESSSEDANDSGSTEARSPSAVIPIPMPTRKVDSAAFDTMYERYSKLYIERRNRKKVTEVPMVDEPSASPPLLVSTEVPVGRPGKPSLRGRALTSYIPNARTYGTSPADSSGSALSSEFSPPRDEPPRPGTPVSISDNEYVADLSCPETPRKARRQTRPKTKGVLAAVSDYGEDLQSSSPRSSLEGPALARTESDSGEKAPRVTSYPNAGGNAIPSRSETQERKHTSMLPFSRKSARRDRDDKSEAKSLESASPASASAPTVTAATAASAPFPAAATTPAAPPPRQRRIGLAPMGGDWNLSVMPSPIIPSLPPPQKQRKSTTGSGRTSTSGSSKGGSLKEKEKEKEGGRSRRRMLPRLGLGGGGGGRNSLDRERETVQDHAGSSIQANGDRDRDGTYNVDPAGSRDGDHLGVMRAGFCSSPVPVHDHYLTDTTPRCSSTLADCSGAANSGVSLSEIGGGSDGDGEDGLSHQGEDGCRG